MPSPLPPPTRRLQQLTLAAALFCASWQAGATTHAALKRSFKVAPSADLAYSIRVRQSGISLNGDAQLAWRSSADKFSIDTATHAVFFGKITESRSSGSIDSFGLAPERFVEKRFRKDPTHTTFNRRANTISFSASDENYPLLGGEQDRNSVIWQLVAVARANAPAFTPNSTWEFFVAGPRDAESWSFRVIGEETIRSPLGEQRSVHIRRAAPPDAKGQQLDIWLAPALEWYPLRLHFSDGDGDSIEQTLEKISKPG